MARSTFPGNFDRPPSSPGRGRGREAGRRLDDGHDRVDQVDGEVLDGQDRPGGGSPSIRRAWSPQARMMKPVTWLVRSATTGAGRWSRLGRMYAAHRAMLVLTVTASLHRS